MKALYFGTVCNLNEYESRLAKCSSKPSVAPIIFESALLDGLYKNGACVEIHSFPMIPVFPKSGILKFGKNVEKLECGYSSRWLNTFNIPVLKQLSRRLDARRIIKRWLKSNSENGVVITYSIPPFLVKDVLRLSKKYRVKTVAIVTDLLSDMYINERKSLITQIKKIYVSFAIRNQGKYDGYVFLTEAMSNVVAPGKPYIVMEGIGDVSLAYLYEEEQKSNPRSIMYAGMLHDKYGIINLIEAFDKLDRTDVELWLFGDGSAREEVKRRAIENPRIKYFGQRDRQEILKYEKKATLLINPRNVDDEFTEYSFPSKTIEYMLSGTPFITTKLKGIPDSYYNYTFVAEDNSVTSLKNIMEQALLASPEELTQVGESAKKYIIDEKNSERQARRIIEFIRGI